MVPRNDANLVNQRFSYRLSIIRLAKRIRSVLNHNFWQTFINSREKIMGRPAGRTTESCSTSCLHNWPGFWHKLSALIKVLYFANFRTFHSFFFCIGGSVILILSIIFIFFGLLKASLLLAWNWYIYFRCYHYKEPSSSTTWPSSSNGHLSLNNDPASSKRFFWSKFEMELNFIRWKTWLRDIPSRDIVRNGRKKSAGIVSI